MNAIKQYARDLRKDGTKGERILWKKLLSRNQTNYRFLRQRIIDVYIVDFFCYELQLVIEIDGSSHFSKPHEDAIRQKYLEKQGLRIVRFLEKDVVYHFADVKRNVLAIIDSIENEEQVVLKKSW